MRGPVLVPITVSLKARPSVVQSRGRDFSKNPLQCCGAELADVPSSEIFTKSVGDLSDVRPRQAFQVMYRVNAVPRELAGER